MPGTWSLSLITLIAALTCILPDFDLETPPQEERSHGGLVTLWAGDETRTSFSFDTATYGSKINDGELLLDNTDLVYNLLARNQLTVGHTRDSTSSIVDLGEAYVNPLRNPRALSPRPPLSIFHTLAISNRDVIYRGPPGKEHRSAIGRQILRSTPQLGIKHFTPEPGHTYLLRFKPGVGSTSNRVVAIHIIDVQPEHTLTFQWKRL